MPEASDDLVGFFESAFALDEALRQPSAAALKPQLMQLRHSYR
jgi:hypothetical protein